MSSRMDDSERDFLRAKLAEIESRLSQLDIERRYSSGEKRRIEDLLKSMQDTPSASEKSSKSSRGAFPFRSHMIRIVALVMCDFAENIATQDAVEKLASDKGLKHKDLSRVVYLALHKLAQSNLVHRGDGRGEWRADPALLALKLELE
jgi:hypothetical protein